ncbi:hypothetical protein [Hydrogenophaga sp. 5NK40-0174]|uniref:hypothetical protein n=1 Tax=Hydrogenophaga sp. 5NK40-0174 TaxID=3127649 RepID=UPI00310ACE42
MNVSTQTLRTVLLIDSVAGLAMATSHGLAADPLSVWTGIPSEWLVAAAVVVFAAASVAGLLGLRSVPPGGMVRMLAAGNFAWVVASLWLAFVAPIEITAIGVIWVIAQAVFVFVLAEMEWMGASNSARLSMA